MATQEKEKKPKGAGKGAKGGERKARGPHAGAGLPVPPPRLRAFYKDTVRPKLMQQFSFTNAHQVPTLEKIVFNVGVGEAIKQPKILDGVVEEAGDDHRAAPVRKCAKKSIANYGLREGQGDRRRRDLAWRAHVGVPRPVHFLVAIPRVRDFRGLGTRSFDGRGNYSMGVKEQMIFPEINYDDVKQIHGMDITFVTSASRDDHALALLKELGMPFKGDDKKGSRLLPSRAQLALTGRECDGSKGHD